MHVIPIGVDTETCRGEPITFQFYSEELKDETLIFLRSPRQATREFFRYLDSLPATRDRHYVLFGHNLAFDMVSFFYDRHRELRNESIEAEWYGWKVEIVYAAVRFAVFRKGNRHVTLIDTGAYFQRKLEILGELVCPHLPKLKMPEGLGQKKFGLKDKSFCAYAMRDAVIAYHVGLRILQMHREMNVTICVSAPHFASKVFRKHFLRQAIPLPPRKVVYSALSAYHGGKNNVTVPAGFYRGVYSLDIKSAYPAAMHTFPAFSDSNLYRAVRGKGTPKTKLPEFGIYCVSGYAKECRWPVLYDHGFKPLQGSFARIWVTGFELNEALRRKEVELDETYGYYYDAERDTGYSPFAAYVDEFFAKKDTALDKIQREFYKLLLNSLYGKFIQTRKGPAFGDLLYDLDEKKIIEDANIVAGGMFNPFIAALITGHTRARIHGLEHKYKALHTSTDGIFLQGSKPREIKGLGGLSIEAYGDLLLFRNKLYIFYAPISAADKPGIKSGKIKVSTIFPKKKIIKYALHGFHGTVEALEGIYRSGIKEYEYIKVNKLRESLRRNLAVNDFVQNTATLNLDLPAVPSKLRKPKGEAHA